MAGFVKVDVAGRIALVTIDRPPVNALNSEVLDELTQTFTSIARRKDVGVAILTGGGETAFVAGADIAEMVGKSGVEMRDFSQKGRRLGEVMAKAPQP
ncbi:MAG: enoyl-CoA hydratase-related protein, partial [Candidatus Thermoplasmatota archaeon]